MFNDDSEDVAVAADGRILLLAVHGCPRCSTGIRAAPQHEQGNSCSDQAVFSDAGDRRQATHGPLAGMGFSRRTGSCCRAGENCEVPGDRRLFRCSRAGSSQDVTDFLFGDSVEMCLGRGLLWSVNRAWRVKRQRLQGLGAAECLGGFQLGLRWWEGSRWSGLGRGCQVVPLGCDRRCSQRHRRAQHWGGCPAVDPVVGCGGIRS